MIQRFRGHSPIIHPAARLAANATLVGCVTVEAASSIWYGAVLRGDESSIHVGAGSNIQDNAVLHCDADCPAVIGRDVTVGHGAILHGCSVEDTCLIGMGAI
ncbi:MAG: gamma carbonic anhydrase family protein, partial [Flavonifractor plautii]